jgi:hypothetical protein
MPVLIQGPKQPGNDIDVYLRPLVDELLQLWTKGGDMRGGGGLLGRLGGDHGRGAASASEDGRKGAGYGDAASTGLEVQW